MKFKTLALAIVAGGALLSAESVLACSTAAWGAGSPPGGGVVGTPVAAQPNSTPTAVKRYAGLCGLGSSAAGQYVQDGTITAADTRLRARFYVYTGTTGGNPVVYRGLNASNAQVLGVTYNATTGAFDFATASGTGSTAAASVAANKWYAVELDWNTTAGNMTAIVQGAGATAALPTVTVTGATGSIEYVQLGWISNASGTPTGSIAVDGYESRRSTAIGRLCRGDANNDSLISVADRIVATNEILGTSLGAGQPDANEDGLVSVADRIVITNRILAADSCP